MNYIRFLKHHVPIPQLLDQPAREHRHLSSELQQTIKRKVRHRLFDETLVDVGI